MKTIFSSKSKNLSEDLSKQGNLALSTFHTVLESLKSINQKASEKQDDLKKEVSTIEMEINALENIKTDYSKVIDNITKILS